MVAAAVESRGLPQCGYGRLCLAVVAVVEPLVEEVLIWHGAVVVE